MKEESRIEALEHELKILKNEIQTTLLEIREQILNHYYPELRAEEPLRSLALPVRPQVARPGVPPKAAPRIEEPSSTLSEITAKGQVQPFSDIFLDDLADDDDANSLVNSRRPIVTSVDDEMDEEYDDEADDELSSLVDDVKVQKIGGLPRNTLGVTPQTREVDFRQLKQAAAGGSAPKAVPHSMSKPVATPTPQQDEAQAAKAGRQTFAALATWVSDGVAKVGKERTSQVVETYATGGKLSSETRNSLLQLISLADDEELASPVGSQEMLALMVGLDQILRDA